jgi:hypothetical protein
MPTAPCSNDDKIIAQTMFLGASVTSFTNSIGWGSQPSQLTVNLVEDETACPVNISQFGASAYSPGHYDTCSGDSCYAVADGSTYDRSVHAVTDRMIPGKVYYSFNGSSGPQSQYWTTPDPGFFGRQTRIGLDGSDSQSSDVRHQYDIIGAPIFFKMKDFNFIGVVQSWKRNLDQGGKNYTVTIDGMSSILNSSYVIVDKYIGSLFSKNSGSLYGSPKNYLGSAGDYVGGVNQGALHNVFNVYGFMESLQPGFFGGARNTEEGMQAGQIISALSAMTSTKNASDFIDWTPNDSYAPKRAFNQFGRIITKAPILDFKSTITRSESGISGSASDNNTFPTFSQHGFIPLGSSGYPEFLLDLSELSVPYADLRIKGPVVSIMDLINTVAEETGVDVFIDCVPIYDTSQKFVIKVKTISRLSQPTTNQIENTIKTFECNNYAITANTIGKEKNESNTRAMLIGGPQQRLYQTKSYRLGYTQANFIFDNETGNFVNYITQGTVVSPKSVDAFGHGKIRFPNFLTTRNQLLNSTAYSEILDDEDELQNNFSAMDPISGDGDKILGGDTDVYYGNYNPTQSLVHGDIAATDRWFPLHLDTICPFFGFVQEEEADVGLGENKKIRPVWFDTWTGQVVIVIRLSELPETNVPLSPIYDKTYDKSSRCASAAGQSMPTARAVVKDDGTLSVNMTNAGQNINGTPSVTITGGSGISNPRVSVIGGRVSVQANGFEYKPGEEVTVTFALNADAGSACFNSTGSSNTEDYFILTESEIRAAITSFDSFLVYSLSKYYKPDLLEMVRRAYKIRIAQALVANGAQSADANRIAEEKVKWYWDNRGTAAAIDAHGPRPSFFAADIQESENNISEDALKDLQVLHKFIANIGRFYGKKYMVGLPYLESYKERVWSGQSLSTSQGAVFVFNGPGDSKYNFDPVNDGAWEEYGNFIDDTIVVGGSKWLNLVNDEGKIQPILGYNNNDYFDFLRKNVCQGLKDRASAYKKGEWSNPVWDYDSYITLLEQARLDCVSTDFRFPLLDISSLDKSNFVTVDTISTSSSPLDLRSFNNHNPITLGSPAVGTDAYGNLGLGGNRKKLYINSQIDEQVYFLKPNTFEFPKVIIDAPGINLTSSASKYNQDPNRTVAANSAIEDIAVHLRISSEPDYNWVYGLLSQVQPMIKIPGAGNWEDFAAGLYAKRSNSASQKVEIAPRAAHPIFAGIPIKSNQYVYGPWVNYPYLDYVNTPASFLPTGKAILQTNDIPPQCSNSIPLTDRSNDANVLSNWINDISIEYKEDLVPWNYGGVCNLDKVALNDLATKVQYQPVIETAQVQIPGLPIFNLANPFSYNNIGQMLYTATTDDFIYTDVKIQNRLDPLQYAIAKNDSSAIGQISSLPNTPTATTSSKTFKVTKLISTNAISSGPIITNISTSFGEGGITTTYSFRTYTRALGLFNKIENQKFRKAFKQNIQTAKVVSELSRKLNNSRKQQLKTLDDSRLDSTTFSSKDFKTQLHGWSPGLVLVGRSAPFIDPIRDPDTMSSNDTNTLQSNPGNFESQDYSAKSWKVAGKKAVDDSVDDADKDQEDTAGLTKLDSSSSVRNLHYHSRMKTQVGLYEQKDAHAEMNAQYGLKSVMSLDGLLSPVSFYPTLHNSTFNFSKYETSTCPFCQGTKERKVQISVYDADNPVSTSSATQTVYCDKCVSNQQKLNASLKSSTTSQGGGGISLDVLPPYIVTDQTDLETLLTFNNTGGAVTTASAPAQDSGDSGGSSGVDIPINLVTLNPIVVSQGEFKNANHQNYIGAHPNDAHDSFELEDGEQREFRDRLKHCIEIVGRGSVDPGNNTYRLATSRNLKIKDNLNRNANKYYNLDYAQYDLMLQDLQRTGNGEVDYTAPEMNQRFFGLRGPIVMHGWGYDTQGYPVPNAADEPYETDEHGNPRRFKIKKETANNTAKYKTLKVGDAYSRDESGSPLFTKTINGVGEPSLTDESDIYKVTIEDDMEDSDTYYTQDDLGSGELGSIISKTQKFENGKWTKKTKLKEFYLNWAEHPELWPVGPIDLRWDASRKIWVTSSGSSGTTYKMVYVTLEQDLITEDDNFVETYPTRGFLDDVEYSGLDTDELETGFRRLVYVKDRSGFTAPRGTKLLCRYDRESGFYEPVSKPTIMTTGTIIDSQKARLELTYVQGRTSRQIPTYVVSYDNSKLNFTVSKGQTGMFTFIGGRWTLTSAN